jgi:hypothetical protein
LVLAPIILPMCVGLLLFNPFPTFFDGRYVLQPGWGRTDMEGVRELGRRLFGALLCWGGVGTVCLALAVWRLRPAYIRQLQGEGRKRKHFWNADRRQVSDAPIRWKEYHVEGLAPLPVLRTFPRWAGLAVTFLVSLASGLFILWLCLLPNKSLTHVAQVVMHLDVEELLKCFKGSELGFRIFSVIALFIATLLTGIRCSGAVSGERERLTWEALLLSPLTVKHLIRGKFWGIIGAVYVYLLAYAIPAVALAFIGGIVATFWTVLLLATTLLAVYFMGAAGLRCSVRAKTSWRSLLGTLGIGYVGGAIVYVVTLPVLFVLAIFIAIGIALIDQYLLGGLLFPNSGGPGAFGAAYFTAFEISTCIGLALCFWGLAWFFLADAQKWVADRERTRHWHQEPMYYRPRRRRPRLRSASY